MDAGTTAGFEGSPVPDLIAAHDELYASLGVRLSERLLATGRLLTSALMGPPLMLVSGLLAMLGLLGLRLPLRLMPHLAAYERLVEKGLVMARLARAPVRQTSNDYQVVVLALAASEDATVVAPLARSLMVDDGTINGIAAQALGSRLRQLSREAAARHLGAGYVFLSAALVRRAHVLPDQCVADIIDQMRRNRLITMSGPIRCLVRNLATRDGYARSSSAAGQFLTWWDAEHGQ